MRVTHVITRLIVGGAQENTIASVFGLATKPGVNVDLLSGPTIGPEGSLERLFDDRPGVLKIIPPLVRAVDPARDWQALKHLTASFRQTKPDIVHTHSGKAGVLGRIAAKRAGVPIIIHTIHGPSFGPFQGAVQNWIFTAAERYAGKFTTHFISVANAMTEQYLAAGIGERTRYTRIFSGFDLEPFLRSRNDPELRAKFGIAHDDFVVGKIARLFELKGHDDLFLAAPELVRQCPRIKFLLVGDGKWRERFESQARSLRLEKHFIFTGLVPPSHVPQYVGIMNALVHLSRREGLPRALPQALAAGKPVVAYNCDGAREICLDGETGFLVPVGDHNGMANGLIQLANDPTLRERFGARGQSLVKESFSVERMVDDIYNLYTRLLNRKQTAST
jgi:glycosyltransferase involved in cell wall biosynthesis